MEQSPTIFNKSFTTYKVQKPWHFLCWFKQLSGGMTIGKYHPEEKVDLKWGFQFKCFGSLASDVVLAAEEHIMIRSVLEL